MGDVVCEECPQKRKRVGADKQGEMGEKLQKLSFLMLEIMLKMDISRQTK